jgi:hypothetical protein
MVKLVIVVLIATSLTGGVSASSHTKADALVTSGTVSQSAGLGA